MFHHWYINKRDGSPKSHRRPRTCDCCRDNPKGGCLLPFRRLRPVRKIAQWDRKASGGVEYRQLRRVRWAWV